MPHHFRVKRAIVGAAAAALLLTSLTATRAQAAQGLVNGGFESGLSGWTVTGDVADAKTEPGGFGASSNHLTHWASTAYSVTTSQRVTGLSRGWWTVSVEVKSGGALAATRLGLTGCGIDGSRALPATEQDDQWVRLAVSAYVVGGACTVQIVTAGPGGSWANVDDVTLTPGEVARQVRGIDLSALAKNEDYGATYLDENGRRIDPVRALARDGANVGRLRVFVNASDGYNNIAHVVDTARRIKSAGMKLLVDFHYSDTWADPGHQAIPAAWRGLTPPQLAQQVYEFTRQTLMALGQRGMAADYVQVGNEINSGMLFPYGQTWDVDPADAVSGPQWDNLASFLTAGYQAVKDVNPRTIVLLHLTNINQGTGALTWWLDEARNHQVPFDMIGLSYYGYWHGSFADLQNAISTISARYERDVMVLETGYPFTLADNTSQAPWENLIDTSDELVAGYPATPDGQAAYFRAVQDVVVSAAGARGLGAIYWEPTWTSVKGNGWDPADPSSGNAWENQAFFSYDNRVLPVAQTLTPDPLAPRAFQESNGTWTR